MAEKKGKKTVGVVCIGSAPAGEVDCPVLVFIPTGEPAKSFFADNYIEFASKVKAFLQNAKNVHFDFGSIPKEACLIDGREIENFEPLSEAPKDLFFRLYFR